MRIAFIGHKRIPSREGGIEIVVDELATRMVARGEQVVVYNRKGHNVAGEEFDNQSSTSDKPYMYRGVKVIPVTTIDAKGLAALTSPFLRHVEGDQGPSGCDPLPCGGPVRAASSGALGRHPYGRHDSRSGLAACEVGQVRLHVSEAW